MSAVTGTSVYFSFVVLDDKILLIGGYKDDENGDDSIEEYDPKEDVWTTLGALVRPMKCNYKIFFKLIDKYL